MVANYHSGGVIGLVAVFVFGRYLGGGNGRGGGDPGTGDLQPVTPEGVLPKHLSPGMRN